MANYLQNEFGTGYLFQHSKEEKEGYDKYTSSKNNVSYRKYYKKGFYGILKGVSVRDSNFGKELSLYMTDKSGETTYINFSLFSPQKNIDDYAESLIAKLPAMKIGEGYRIFPYNIKEEGKKYSKIGVSVVEADVEKEKPGDKVEQLSYTYIKGRGTSEEKLVKGDIPKVEWEEDEYGDPKPNAKAKNKYLYDTLIANTSNSSKEEEPKKEEVKKEPVTAGGQEEDDDLPF